MIVVRLEFWPFGRKHLMEPIGTIEIINDTTGIRDAEGTMTHGNYVIRMYRKAEKTVWKTLRVEGFPRLRLSAWHLLRRAMNAAFEAEDGETVIETAEAKTCAGCGKPVSGQYINDASGRAWHLACAQEALKERLE